MATARQVSQASRDIEPINLSQPLSDIVIRLLVWLNANGNVTGEGEFKTLLEATNIPRTSAIWWLHRMSITHLVEFHKVAAVQRVTLTNRGARFVPKIEIRLDEPLPPMAAAILKALSRAEGPIKAKKFSEGLTGAGICQKTVAYWLNRLLRAGLIVFDEPVDEVSLTRSGRERLPVAP